MNLTLTRTDIGPTGVFGKLVDEDNNAIAVTLEHAYQQGEDWLPKIPSGTYVCQRGMHQLEGMKQPFETFEITNVPGHTNCLIHMGNWEKDSDGCILVGQTIVSDMITHSVDTFHKFMDLETGLDQFTLVINDV